MCQGRFCFSRNQFSLCIIQPQSYLKTIVQTKSYWYMSLLFLFLPPLDFSENSEQIFLFLYNKEKRGKKKTNYTKNQNQEPALIEFCLARFSSKNYSPFDLLLIYCKTIACYARIASSCRTKPLQHKAEMLMFTRIWTVTTTLWTLNCFHFGDCTGYSWT